MWRLTIHNKMTTALRRMRHNLSLLTRNGCDISEMQDYFGYKNTNKHIRKISFEPIDDSLLMFMLNIKSYKRDNDIFDIYIKELPREINIFISEFLTTERKITCRIELPENYPFSQPIWKLISYKENGRSTTYPYLDVSLLYCGKDYSPISLLDSDILCYLSKLNWLSD